MDITWADWLPEAWSEPSFQCMAIGCEDGSLGTGGFMTIYDASQQANADRLALEGAASQLRRGARVGISAQTEAYRDEYDLALLVLDEILRVNQPSTEVRRAIQNGRALLVNGRSQFLANDPGYLATRAVLFELADNLDQRARQPDPGAVPMVESPLAQQAETALAAAEAERQAEAASEGAAREAVLAAADEIQAGLARFGEAVQRTTGIALDTPGVQLLAVAAIVLGAAFVAGKVLR